MKYTFEIGSKVEGGSTVETYDSGRVLDIGEDGDITVGWASGVNTTQPATVLRPYGTDVPPTSSDIRDLMSEAGEAGDDAMVRLCERALDEVGTATNKVWAAIRSARAQA